MTDTERMKNSIKSFDVVDFKDEDELAEMTVEMCAPKLGHPKGLDVSTTEIQSKGIGIEICGGDDAEIDYNHDAASSCTPIETEDFSKKTPELTHVLHSCFKSHEHDAEINPKIIESGSVSATMECCSSPVAAARLEDDLNISLQQPSCNDRSEDDESLSAKSPAIANNNASSGGPSSGNCSSDWNLGDERVGIVFYPDYIDCCGTHYLDSVVNFSRSFVEARSKTMSGNERTFHIYLEIEDIVKIESKWSARCEAGIINIHFISKDGVQDDIIYNASASRLQELKFPVVDSNWYQKHEAIGSLDVRYKTLWNVLLDTGMDDISPLPEREAMVLTRSYFPKFDKPFEEVIYPKGDPDAVSMSMRDVDLLLPDTFVNDTIIDFYIKYLKSRQKVEEKTKFHFFNSFFFRKLADMDKDPSSAFDGKAAFQRVRKWTRKINLLEKDFIVIPVNYNYHWSLIVICYFGEVASYKDAEDDKSLRVPCIMHMDSLKGNHEGLKDLIQSYLWEEWKERLKETSEDLYSNFRNLKFIPLELPQQQNSYDCGLFLLHYVELFLEEVPANFSIYQIAASSKFLQPDWFPPGEASMKRTRIEKLINELLVTQSEDCHLFGGSGMNCTPEGTNASHGYDNGCHESSIRQIDQGIGMTLLPDSSTRSTQCNITSGLVLKDLFKQPSAPEPFNDSSWGSLGNSASVHEFKRPVSLTEEEVEANECFTQQGLAEPVFEHIDDGVTLDEPDFPYSSGDFRLNPLHQPTTDDVDSSPVTAGSDSDDDDEKWQSVELNYNTCSSPQKIEQLTFSSRELLSPEKSSTLAEINDLDDNPSSLKEFRQEANQLRNHYQSHEDLYVNPAVLEGIIPNDETHLCSDGHELNLEANEQRSAKRMRIAPPDGGEDENTNDLSEDLHL